MFASLILGRVLHLNLSTWACQALLARRTEKEPGYIPLDSGAELEGLCTGTKNYDSSPASKARKML